MAIKYFDLNGSTAGFGTLTGAWNTTGAAFWSDSSAGTAVPTNYTFTDVDTAAFGFAGTTATAGTATIATGVNVTLNQITTANLAGLQTIAAGGTGKLTLAGTTPTINVGSAGGLTISAPIEGTAGFTKAGTGALTLTNATPANNTLTGTVTVSGGILSFGTGVYGSIVSAVSVAQLPSATAYTLNNATVQLSGINTAAQVTIAGNFSGDGELWVFGGTTHSSPGATFTGTIADLGTTVAKFKGVSFKNNQITTVRGIVTAIDVPRCITYWSGVGSTAAQYALFLQSFEISAGAVGGTYSTKIYMAAFGAGAVALPANSQRFLANQNNGNGGVVLTGGVERLDDAAGDTDTLTLTLGGTNTDENELTGNIVTTTGGPLAIAKTGVGRWALSGATSTYTGGVTISVGTLVAKSNTAFGSSSAGAVTLASGATLELSGGITLNKASVALNLQGGTVKNLSGDNTYSGATAPLTGGATTFDVTAGSLTFNPTISSATVLGIVKSSTGTLRLNNAANSYTGTTTVNGGTLEVLRLANLSANSSIGAPTTSVNGTIAMAAGSTLKHVGVNEASSTERIITIGAAGTLTIDSSGTGTSSLTLTTTNSGAITPFATGNSTVVFTGTNTVSNTCARTVANPATFGATSLTKSGTNTWSFTGTLSHTGTTTCTAGVLDLGSTNRTLTGALVVSGGTVQNSTNTLDAASVTMTGGTITAPLTGTAALTISSGTATLQPNAATGSNAQTGNISVSAGAVVRLVTPDAVNVETAGNGRAIGNGDVTCAGTIRTATSGTSNQRGQARYKSLTLNSGARLEIGAA